MVAITICSDFGAPKVNSDTVSTVSPSIAHEVMGPDAYRGTWNSSDENDYTKYTIHWTTFIQKQLNIKLVVRSDFSITWSISTELHKSSKYWHILSPSDNHQLKYKYATLAVIFSWKSQHVHSFHCFPFYLPWSDGTGCHDLSFLNVKF